MEFLSYLLVFIWGAVIGSFLNVAVLRHNTKMSLWNSSFCFSCRKKLTWRELFPIVSFVFQRGKCRHCRSRISRQYPAVEAATGILFVLIFWNFGGTLALEGTDSLRIFGNLIFYWTIFSILVAITVYDLLHKIIPNAFVYIFAFLSLGKLFFDVGMQDIFFAPYVWDLLAGPIFAAPLALLWLISGGRWIGLGDAKLALGIGWLLGFMPGISALLLAFWTGALVGVLLIFFRKLLPLCFKKKRFTIKSEIPFAPFLVLGTMLSFLGVTPVEFVGKLTLPLFL